MKLRSLVVEALFIATIPVVAVQATSAVDRASTPNTAGRGESATIDLMVGMPEPYALVLLLAGVLASLILIRRRVRHAPDPTVKKLPGDAR